MKASLSGSHVQRAVTKASANYRNPSWDIVDAVREGNVKLEELKKEDLPKEMQSMTAEERKAHVKANATQRKAIQEEIRKLNEERKQYVAEEMKKRSESGEQTFDAAIIKALREQAERKKFQLK